MAPRPPSRAAALTVTAALPSRLTPATTLAAVLAAVAAADIPDRRRQDMASAVRTVARLLGRQPEDIPADPRALAQRLAAIAPLAAGLSARTWANVRSLFRAALELVRPMLKGRSTTRLSPAWQALHDQLPTRSDRMRLSRIMRWMSAKTIEPDAVTAGTLAAFKAELHGDSLLRDPDNTWTDVCWGWNRSVERVPGWPQLPIAKLSRKVSYSLPWSAFPASLKADVDRWLMRLAGRDFSDDGPARPARASTLATRDYQLRSFASALVHQGRSPQSLTCLADLVAYDAYVAGLRFYYERRDKTSSGLIHGMAGMLKGVARHWCKADDATLAQMAGVVKRLAIPPQGMTTKNRTRLRAFDDPENEARLLHLPQRLRAAADSRKLPPHRAAVLAGIAVAIELQIFAPVRLQNLVSIDIERHLVRTGAKLHLVIPASEVKNTTDLEFELMPRTAELIAWYRDRWWKLLAPPGCTALFPGRAGGPKASHTLSLQVSQTVLKHTGLAVNVHLFRHIGAKIYLEAMPGGYEVIRRVLGHKKMDTTARFYVGLEGKAAARHFDQVIQRRLQRLQDADAANPTLKRPQRPARGRLKPVREPLRRSGGTP